MNGGIRPSLWRLGLLLALGLATTSCTGAGPTASTSTAPTVTVTVTATPGPTTSSTPTAAAPVTGIVKGKNGWSTYTNVELGFSFRFPSKMYVQNGSPCTKKNTAGDWTYQDAPGVVPATVVQDGAEFWLVQATGYQRGDHVTKQKGSYLYDYYKSCTKRQTSVTLLRAYEAQNTYYRLDGLPIVAEPAHNQTDVHDALSAIFSNCSTLNLTGLKKSASGPWREPVYACPGNPAFPGGATDARWYKPQGLFVAFLLGQAYHIYNPDQQPVDTQVVSGFAPLS